MLKQLLIGLFTLISIYSSAQTKLKSNSKQLTVAFYNVENLFDTIDNAGVIDEEFLPNSPKNWNQQRYFEKLDHISEVMVGLASKTDEMPDVIGLCEIENRGVLVDLIARKGLLEQGYKVVHEDSKDARGIDVAFLIKSKEIKEITHLALEVDLKPDTYKTRDILQLTATWNKKDTIAFFVNHWPSRRGGETESEPKREQAAAVLKNATDNYLKSHPNGNVVAVGDFNDYPTNKSILEVLGASNDSSATLFNLNYDLYVNQKIGSHYYKGEWGMLDQIIVSKSMLNRLAMSPDSKTPLNGVFSADFMLYTDKKTGEKSPSRTYGGNKYFGGYSDHLPTYAVFVK